MSDKEIMQYPAPIGLARLIAALGLSVPPQQSVPRLSRARAGQKSRMALLLSSIPEVMRRKMRSDT